MHIRGDMLTITITINETPEAWGPDVTPAEAAACAELHRDRLVRWVHERFPQAAVDAAIGNETKVLAGAIRGYRPQLSAVRDAVNERHLATWADDAADAVAGLRAVDRGRAHADAIAANLRRELEVMCDRVLELRGQLDAALSLANRGPAVRHDRAGRNVAVHAGEPACRVVVFEYRGQKFEIERRDDDRVVVHAVHCYGDDPDAVEWPGADDVARVLGWPGATAGDGDDWAAVYTRDAG